jgi:epoxyqueuosine reductase QueG
MENLPITTQDIKEFARSLGANMCGIASADRFTDAPQGFKPTDIYSGCRSVVVFAKRIVASTAYAESLVPYTQTKDLSMLVVDKIGFDLGLWLEDRGIVAVPVPSDNPYEHYEPERLRGQAILSLRHAGWLAGLGVLGKNTLLMTEQYGNMIHIGAVLVDADLEQDPLSTFKGCRENCRKCLDACPQKALNGTTVDQSLCRPHAFYTTSKGYLLFRCNTCRRICPKSLGKQSQVKRLLKSD